MLKTEFFSADASRLDNFAARPEEEEDSAANTAWGSFIRVVVIVAAVVVVDAVMRDLGIDEMMFLLVSEEGVWRA